MNFSNIDFDLSNLGNHFVAILAEPGSKVVFEGGSIFGANVNSPKGLIILNNSDLQLLNGVTIRDNRNIGTGGIINMNGGDLTLDNAVFSGNMVKSPFFASTDPGLTDPDTRWGIIKSEGANVAIRNSQVRNNNNTFLYASEVEDLNVSGSVFDSNKGSSVDSPGAPYSNQPNNGTIFLIKNSVLNIENNNSFTNNQGFNGAVIHALSTQINIGNDNFFERNSCHAGGIIYGEETTISIGENNRFSGNISSMSGSIFMLNPSKSLFIGKNNTFENNKGADAETFTYNGGTITVSGGTVEIEDGNEFSNNRDRIGGVLYASGDVKIGKAVFRSNRGIRGGVICVSNGKLSIADGAGFIENQADYEGGAIRLSQSDAEIGIVSFINNSGTTDKTEGYNMEFNGGAIFQQGGTLTLEGTIFIGNKASRINAMGGAVFVEPYYDYTYIEPEDPDDPYAEWERVWGAQAPMELTINNVTFRDNTSDGWGGALQAGNTARIDNKDDMLTVRLNTADFTGNQAALGGGAIMIGPEGSVSAKNVLIGNTDPRAEDTVIVTDSGSKLRIHSREGAAITGQGMKILAVDNDADFSVSDRMFSGGFHNWVIDANKTASSNLRNDLLEPVSDRTFTGTLFTAAPGNGSGEGAPVTIRDNSSAVPDTGSVILNFGVLEIGTKGAGTDIRKIWNDASDAGKKRPDTDRFIRALRVMDRNGDPVTGELILSGTRDNGDGSVCSNYYAENDPFIGLRICPPGDVYHVTIDGLLPAGAPYRIEEIPLENYPDPVVEGTFETGFTITNTYVPSKPEPEKPPMEFYQLLLDAGILPGTGFPTKEDIR